MCMYVCVCVVAFFSARGVCVRARECNFSARCVNGVACCVVAWCVVFGARTRFGRFMSMYPRGRGFWFIFQLMNWNMFNDNLVSLFDPGIHILVWNHTVLCYSRILYNCIAQ